MEGLHKNELRQPSSSQRSLLSEKEDIGALESQTKTQRLLSLPSKTKEKTKNFLHANSQGEPDQNPKTENNEGLGLIENDPAFKPSLLDKQKSMSFGGTPKKARESLRAIVSAVVHPKESIKRKATQATAGKLSSTQRPYLSRNADLNFLKAHSELDQATSSRSSRHTSSDDEGMDLATHECQEKVNEIEAHRESLRVAWTTSRHINRVRVVPRRRFSFPDNTKFSINNDNGVPYQFDWLKWLGYVKLPFISNVLSNDTIRTSFSIHKTSVLNILMTLTSSRSMSIAFNIILNEW